MFNGFGFQNKILNLEKTLNPLDFVCFEDISTSYRFQMRCFCPRYYIFGGKSRKHLSLNRLAGLLGRLRELPSALGALQEDTRAFPERSWRVLGSSWKRVDTC